MADALSSDLFAHSVTANDMSEYKGNGVVNYVIPWGMYFPYQFALPSELPPDWIYPASFAGYFSRDLILRKTPRHEPFWAAGISKAAAKLAAKSFEVKGNRVERFKQLLVQWGGDGYVPSQKRGIRDYLTTNNGAFYEVVRASDSPVARTLGLVHLDSLRVVRTNDPNIPYLFRDLKNQYHELREDQVIALTDMPQTELAAFGRGVCAADDLYLQIYKMAVIVSYFIEKITGTGANVLDFITGINDPQVQSILTTAAQEAKARGQVYYQGHVISAVLAQVEMKHVEIKLREIPDGYVKENEIDEALLAYAARIGLDPQDLKPGLMGTGALGTGAQSVVLHEKQEGSTLATYEKELTHQIDYKVLPDRMSFTFSESDLREQAQKAQIGLVHAQTRQAQVTTGEITAQEARQLAIEAEDMPRDIQVETLMDEERPVEDETIVEQAAPVAEPSVEQPTATQPAQGDLTKPQEQKVESALEKLNLSGIQITSAMGIVHQVATGEISRDQGVNALQILLNLTEEQAGRLIGGASTIPTAPPVTTQKEIDALIALKQSIDAAREALRA